MGYESMVRVATTEKGYAVLCEKMAEEYRDRGVGGLLCDREPDYLIRYAGGVVFGWDAVDWEDGGPLSECIFDLCESVPFEVAVIPADVSLWQVGKTDELPVRVEPFTDIRDYVSGA